MLVVKNLPANARDEEAQVRSLGLEGPLQEGMETCPVFLPGKSHGWRGAWWAMVHRVAKSQT